MAQKIETIEQFLALAENLPENVNRRHLAKQFGLVLPKEPVEIKPVGEQLQAAKLLNHKPKSGKGPERTYVEFPAIKLAENNSTRSVWVRAEVAREVFQRGLELCDKHNI